MKLTAKKDYEPVIGLEVHAQLLTSTKMFCSCRVEYGAPPNSRTCPVCLGHPGALPVLNSRAVEYAARMILALRGTVQRQSVFARKNYFYPDLPKGYQISQYDQPIGRGGKVRIELDEMSREINLVRIHLEEDAGKSVHPERNKDVSLIDMNRCGIPLLEIVTEPDLHSPQEAHAFLSKLKQILQYLKICSGDMEKGALRCDANISLQHRGRCELGTRTELKNLNSFRAVERALEYEIKRQTEILASGDKVKQETLLWDDNSRRSEPMRGKEESEDYRYFPEPDLIPLELSENWIDDIGSELPELPDAKKERFVNEYAISSYDATVLTSSPDLADYFESTAAEISDRRLAANWIIGDVLREINEAKVEVNSFFIRPNMLAELLRSVESDIISGKMARDVFTEMIATGKSAGDIIGARGLRQIANDDQLKAIIQKVLESEEIQVKKYRNGKTRLFDYFVGQVMKETGGRAKPELVTKILREKLDGR